MEKRDCMMFGLYLVVIAMGAVMIADRHSLLGFSQICVVALAFGLRLYRVTNKPR